MIWRKPVFHIIFVKNCLMTISIQLQTSDDLKLVEPLLKMLRQFEMNVSITSESIVPASKKKSSRITRPKAGIVERLHGVIQVPEDFDYKSILASELLQKHGVHG